FHRRRFMSQAVRQHPQPDLVRSEVLFPLDGALAPRIPPNLVMKFVEGNGHQQSPEVAATLEVVAPLATVCEEAAVNRLDHILRIDPPCQLGGEPTARQRDQTFGVAPKQLFRCLLISLAPTSHQVAGVVAFRYHYPSAPRAYLTSVVQANSGALNHFVMV